MDEVGVELNMEIEGELDPELDCLLCPIPIVSLAASVAMDDKTFSVAMRFSVWFDKDGWECASLRSERDKLSKFVFHLFSNG